MENIKSVPKGTNPNVNGQFGNGAGVGNTVPNSVNPQTGKYNSKLD